MSDARILITPIALNKPDAAAALGMSVDSFDRYVGPSVRCIRRGRLRLYPVAELTQWANDNAETLFNQQAAA